MQETIPEYTVSEISFAIKRTMEDAFARVRVRGEIFGCKRADSGHYYLSLKDENANPSVCKSGRLGRSFGCPALPQALTKPIINTIKGGSVLFIYANNKEYMAKSSILPNQTSQELFTEACESEQTVSAHL